jgi:hypothetical protein
MFAPLIDGTMAYVPTGLELVADVENVSVKVSPFTAPFAAPANVGFAAPYTREVLFAVILNKALLTVSETVPAVLS